MTASQFGFLATTQLAPSRLILTRSGDSSDRAAISIVYARAVWRAPGALDRRRGNALQMLACLKTLYIICLTDLGASHDNINSGVYRLCGDNSRLSKNT